MNKLSKLLLTFAMAFAITFAVQNTTPAYAAQETTTEQGTAAKSDSTTAVASDNGTESTTAGDSETETESTAVAESKSETESAAVAESKNETESTAVAESKSVTKSTAVAESKSETKSAAVKTTSKQTTSSSSKKKTTTKKKTVKKVQSVKFTANKVTIRLNKTKKLKVKLKNVTSKKLTWKSSNTKVVKVTKNGTLKPVKKGTATITVTIKGTKIHDKIKVHVKNPKALYSASQFRRMGVVRYHGYRWTYYSQKVLSGGGLKIPGRHTERKYVCDKNGYVVLASSTLKKGTIVRTPFGFVGKVYDSGCAKGTIDVYTNF